MSINQYQRNLDQIDKEIAQIEKMLARYEKELADADAKIRRVKQTITPNTSASVRKSKYNQIEKYTRDREKAQDNCAKERKKLADKRQRRIIASQRLNKAQQDDVVKARQNHEQQQNNIMKNYEIRISALSAQIETMLEQERTSAAHVMSHRSNVEEYDVFISHAHEDKATFVDEFVKILEEDYHIKVWYDNDAIKWGDSLRTKINEGLKKSKFAIVVLSPDYIRKYWTQYELNGLFQKESELGKVILPIWHHLSVTEVRNFDLALADRSALNTAYLSPSEIAEFLLEMLRESTTAPPQQAPSSETIEKK